MAGSTLEEGAQRHQKVYSFLKRVLPQDRYEGIRVIEPCVVVADGFKKTSVRCSRRRNALHN